MTPNARTPRGEQAIAANQEAAFYETVPRTSVSDHEYYADVARHMRAKADTLLQPPTDLQIGASEAITWENRVGEAAAGETARIIETLEHPTSVNAGASGKRMRAALAADILEAAIDAEQSAQASNSIEKILCDYKGLAASDAGFGRYFDLLKGATPSVTLAEEGPMRRLNRARVGPKHHGILPAQEMIEGLRASTTSSTLGRAKKKKRLLRVAFVCGPT